MGNSGIGQTLARYPHHEGSLFRELNLILASHRGRFHLEKNSLKRTGGFCVTGEFP